jgi:hypothetical protein
LHDGLQSEFDRLSEHVDNLKTGEIVNSEDKIKWDMRRLFKKMHEILYEIEKKKTVEVEKTFKKLFGKRVKMSEA